MTSAPKFDMLSQKCARCDMKKYVCNLCGYEYDPELGDEDGGIAAGTPFSELPDDWMCPVCGASKDNFSELD